MNKQNGAEIGHQRGQVAARVQQVREAKGLTQTELANIAGLEQSYISKIESGKSLPSDETLQKISSAIGMTLGEFKAPIAQSARQNAIARSLGKTARMISSKWLAAQFLLGTLTLLWGISNVAYPPRMELYFSDEYARSGGHLQKPSDSQLPMTLRLSQFRGKVFLNSVEGKSMLYHHHKTEIVGSSWTRVQIVVGASLVVLSLWGTWAGPRLRAD